MRLYTVYYISVNCSLCMFWVVTPPILRSTYNCNYSIWHWSNRLCYFRCRGAFGTLVPKCSKWPQTVLYQHFRMATECVRSIYQDGHRRCNIKTSGWPQNVLDQYIRMATECATSTLQDGHRMCYINTSGWPQNVLHQHLRMATDCATSTPQDGHRMCYINTSRWPQNELHQHIRMATGCATSTPQDGHRLCYINASGWPQNVLHSVLFRRMLERYRLFYPVSTKCNLFCFTFHDLLLRLSVSQ